MHSIHRRVAAGPRNQGSLLAAPLPENATTRPHPLAAPPAAAEPPDWRPKRLVRTVLSSLAEVKEFGGQMAIEAKRRRFFEAAAKAFRGDGLAWNWSIWKQHFRQFTPILDFIHVLSYLFLTAKALHAAAADAWSQYLVWMRGCWQGDVAQVLEDWSTSTSTSGRVRRFSQAKAMSPKTCSTSRRSGQVATSTRNRCGSA